MRTQKSEAALFSAGASLVIFVFTTFGADALAQSSAYKRPGKTATKSADAGASTSTSSSTDQKTNGAASTASGASGSSAGGSGAAASGSSAPTGVGTSGGGSASGGANAASGSSGTGEKVDISDLEARYWAPKDTEFNVVQNRLYTKAKKIAVTASYGSIINDTYSSGSSLGLAINYYFNEKMGVEFAYDKFNVSENTLVQSFINQNGAVPNYNLLNSYMGAAFNWIPFYGKMSVLDKKIIYFDLSVNPGLGITRYTTQQLGGGGATNNGFTVALDISQHFFLNQNWAIRFDFKNHIYQEAVKGYRTGVDIQTQQTTNTTIMFGASYYH